jgi:tripartite-type tricarboxylate transporter receptor subunit TctC
MKAIRLMVLMLGLTGAGLGANLTAPGAALAADPYPTRPIRFLVGFAAGGPVDIVARVMSEYLSSRLGQQLVVENRGGSGGNLAVQAMITSPPDGYTILFDAPNNAISASLYKNLPFDFMRDSVPVAGIMMLTNIMIVPPSLPVKNVAEFVAYAKAHPGELSFASSGNGTSVHMSAELFKAMTQIDIIHVPYRGSAPAYPDLMTGKVHVMFDNLPGAIEFVRTGKMRALGVTTAKRSEILPDVPAIGETIAGYDASVWYGISAPKGTPPEIVAFLNKAVNDALADPKMKARLAELGGAAMPMAPADFGKFIADETVKWAKVVKFANITVE